MMTPADTHIIATIMTGVLHGLHSTHEAKSEQGEALGIVHRDVSPQNVLVGVDGVPRVLDFGVAKAVGLRVTASSVPGRRRTAIRPSRSTRADTSTRSPLV
jgi:serine/threonine-protein kinase